MALALLAGISPTMVICEMLDSESGDALSKDAAIAFASDHNMVFMEGEPIRAAYQSLSL